MSHRKIWTIRVAALVLTLAAGWTVAHLIDPSSTVLGTVVTFAFAGIGLLMISATTNTKRE
jgi:hypothetical protein